MIRHLNIASDIESAIDIAINSKSIFPGWLLNSGRILYKKNFNMNYVAF